MAFNLLPPSPALSACDSLDDIEDLDAFLAAQGPLSIFPTPDPKDEILRSQHAVLQLTEDSSRLSGVLSTASHYTFIAETFAAKTTECIAGYRRDTSSIAVLLARADLPIELMALAYAILDALPSSKIRSLDCGPDLLLTAALALADIHINDHPYHLATWIRFGMTSAIGVRTLDRLMLRMLKDLDWTIHRLCDPAVIAKNVTVLSGNTPHVPRLHTRHSSTALWALGQLTPAENSPSQQTRSQPAYYLPLL